MAHPIPFRAALAFLLALPLALRMSSPAAAQGLPSPLAPSNAAPIVYCPSERLAAGAASPFHVLNVFLPRGTPPATGWPVVVGTGYGGGASVPPLSALRSTGGESAYWNLVSAGIAVVFYGAPGIANGKGLWYPAGHPSGRYESFRPQDDCPEKAAEWALQWVKVQTLYPFDLTRVGLRGSSGGAVLAIRTAMGPDRARATGSAHVRASTRVAAILAIQPPTSAWALEQGPELTIPFPRHLEQAARPGMAATQLSQAAPDLQKAYSLMHVVFATPEARANAAQQPLCLVYGDPVLRIGGAPAPFDLDASGFPVLHDVIKQPLQHDSWFGYVFWKRLTELSGASAAFHASSSVFAMRDVNALAAPLALHTRTYTGTVHAQRAVRIGHDWLVARLVGAQRSLPRDGDAIPRTFTAALAGAPAELEGEVIGGALVLRVRGRSGTVALLGAAPAVDSACDHARPPLARLVLDPDDEGVTEIVLPLPDELDVLGGAIAVRALFLEPGGAGGVRPRWTNALVLDNEH